MKPIFMVLYSTIVAANLQNLVESDFVTEKQHVTSKCRKMYSYNLNDEAVDLARKLKKTYSKEGKAIENVVKNVTGSLIVTTMFCRGQPKSISFCKKIRKR